MDNNPIVLIDPDGMGSESTHLDEKGNVLAEYNDGDKGVYVHKNGTSQSDVDKQRQGGKYTGSDGNYIGSLGGKLDISGIAKNIFANNKSEAANLTHAQWVANVLPGGKWDYKNNKNTIFGVAWVDGNSTGTHTSFLSDNLKFDNAADFGNYNAGYTGSIAGISREAQYKWAGLGEVAKFDNVIGRLSQIIKGTPPYGDRITDYLMNTAGMNQGTIERAKMKLKFPTSGIQTERIYKSGPY
jgi:Bacterial toxin 44